MSGYLRRSAIKSCEHIMSPGLSRAGPMISASSALLAGVSGVEVARIYRFGLSALIEARSCFIFDLSFDSPDR